MRSAREVYTGMRGATPPKVEGGSRGELNEVAYLGSLELGVNDRAWHLKLELKGLKQCNLSKVCSTRDVVGDYMNNYACGGDSCFFAPA